LKNFKQARSHKTGVKYTDSTN